MSNRTGSQYNVDIDNLKLLRSIDETNHRVDILYDSRNPLRLIIDLQLKNKFLVYSVESAEFTGEEKSILEFSCDKCGSEPHDLMHQVNDHSTVFKSNTVSPLNVTEKVYKAHLCPPCYEEVTSEIGQAITEHSHLFVSHII